MPIIKKFVFFLLVLLQLAKFDVYASDCADVLPGGDLNLTTACSFSGSVNGVDAGEGEVNTAVLTLEPGGILTILPDQTITVGAISFKGGSLIKMPGGSLKIRTPIWMIDADLDGYPATTIQYPQPLPPLNSVRRNVLSSITQPDPSDSYYCPDAFNPNITCSECKNGDLSYQPDGSDRFYQCLDFNLCNGLGSCTLHAKRIFVSSSSYSGNFGGLSGADQICQSLADSTNLGGIWKAWLSDSKINVSDRYTHSTQPYLLVDQITKIADDWSDFASFDHYSGISITETGATIKKTDIWTNTKADGFLKSNQPNETCQDWTEATKTYIGTYGKNNLTTQGEWTNYGISICNKKKNLYCVEQ